MIDFPTCGVQASWGIRMPFAEISPLRKNVGSFGGRDLVPLVRHSDEQTVLALTAVLSAMDKKGWRDRSFTNWGVVASGRALGRSRFDAAFERNRRMGARGVSPSLVPHLSLHAIPSSMSIVFGMHGPHFGVSGRTNQLSETILTGLGGVQREGDVEGMWIVVTELDPEPTLDENGNVVNEVYGLAAAMAVTRDEGNLEITLGPGTDAVGKLADLVAWLQAPTASSWRCGVPGVGALDVRRTMPLLIRKAG